MTLKIREDIAMARFSELVSSNRGPFSKGIKAHANISSGKSACAKNALNRSASRSKGYQEHKSVNQI